MTRDADRDRRATLATAPATTNAPNRDALVGAIGLEIVRFQDASSALDDAAAAVLALARADLPCVTALLFQGPLPVEQLAGALGRPPAQVRATLAHLELAGYVRPAPSVTRGLQDSHTARIRELLAAPPAQRKNRLRRVQLFIEANLDRAIRLADLAARAGLSAYHFAHAFKTSTGVAPRAFVEARRVEKKARTCRSGRTSYVVPSEATHVQRSDDLNPAEIL